MPGKENILQDLEDLKQDYSRLLVQIRPYRNQPIRRRVYEQYVAKQDSLTGPLQAVLSEVQVAGLADDPEISSARASIVAVVNELVDTWRAIDAFVPQGGRRKTRRRRARKTRRRAF